MIKPKLFIFSKNEVITKSVSKYLSLFTGSVLRHDFDPEKSALTYNFIEDIPAVLNNESPATLLNTAVIIDCTNDPLPLSDKKSLDPTAEGDEPTSLQIAASLILAYPEIYWIILGTGQNTPRPGESNVYWKDHFVDVGDMASCLELLVRHQKGFRTLFDPSGLRTELKTAILDISPTKTAFKHEIRQILKSRTERRAVAIDEELSYVMLHGYTAYRSGYRCNTVTSKNELERLNEDHLLNPVKITLSLEDLDLKLTDMVKEDEETINATPDWAGLEERRRHYCFLPACHKRRLIITGVGDTQATQCCNLPFPRRQEYTTKTGYRIKSGMTCFPMLICRRNKSTDCDVFISKPIAGIYALRDELCNRDAITEPLKNAWDSHSSTESIKKLRKRSQLWWSCCKFGKNSNGESNNMPEGHSATNKVLIIGEMLLERARAIAKSADTTAEAIYAATLSLEAKELLYGRSQTTSLEMYAMQQKMEVTAECCFLGIGQEISLENRILELAHTVDKILRVYRHSDHKKYVQSYNAQIEMINDIRMIFKNYEQFDEEDACIDKIRKLSQGLHFYSLKWPRKIWSFTGERYFNWLMSSGTNIFIAICLIILGYALFYMKQVSDIYISASHPEIINSEFSCFFSKVLFDGLIRSAETFFSIQPFTDQIILSVKDKSGFWFNAANLSEMICGYFHLGIFIAWLYQKLARR